MKRNQRRAAMAVAAAFGLMALDASATDVTLVNAGDTSVIHPYFRTNNCWATDFGGVPDPTTGWVFFGGVLGHGQFTWTTFEVLLNPACKHPKLELTFVPDNAPPPVRNPDHNVKAKIDLTQPTVTITVVDNPIIQRGDDDDDD